MNLNRKRRNRSKQTLEFRQAWKPTIGNIAQIFKYINVRVNNVQNKFTMWKGIINHFCMVHKWSSVTGCEIRKIKIKEKQLLSPSNCVLSSIGVHISQSALPTYMAGMGQLSGYEHIWSDVYYTNVIHYRLIREHT